MPAPPSGGATSYRCGLVLSGSIHVPQDEAIEDCWRDAWAVCGHCHEFFDLLRYWVAARFSCSTNRLTKVSTFTAACPRTKAKWAHVNRPRDPTEPKRAALRPT